MDTETARQRYTPRQTHRQTGRQQADERQTATQDTVFNQQCGCIYCCFGSERRLFICALALVPFPSYQSLHRFQFVMVAWLSKQFQTCAKTERQRKRMECNVRYRWNGYGRTWWKKTSDGQTFHMQIICELWRSSPGRCACNETLLLHGIDCSWLLIGFGVTMDRRQSNLVGPDYALNYLCVS